MAALNSSPPGSGTVTVVGSGIQGKSHDGLDSVKATYLDLSTIQPRPPSRPSRNELLGALLGRPVSQLGNLPGPLRQQPQRLRDPLRRRCCAPTGWW